MGCGSRSSECGGGARRFFDSSSWTSSSHPVALRLRQLPKPNQTKFRSLPSSVPNQPCLIVGARNSLRASDGSQQILSRRLSPNLLSSWGGGGCVRPGLDRFCLFLGVALWRYIYVSWSCHFSTIYFADIRRTLQEFRFPVSSRDVFLKTQSKATQGPSVPVTANRLSNMVMSLDNLRGFALATSSSAFIGSSFVIKKIGLKKAGDVGVRAGSGGYSYLSEPLWWIGMVTMILGEVANFAAYAFAPAILVTPLGALSIIFSAVLAHFILKERLHMFGVVGCALCVVGSVDIVLHAPMEKKIDSVSEIWHLATEPGFIVYSCLAVAVALVMMFWVVHHTEQRKMLAYIAICSLFGSLTVISVKAVAIALKLSFNGVNQFVYIQTWFFIAVVIICCLVQLNYLNKALDSFNTAVVAPVYYVMFTILTIFANMIMYKDWDSQNATQIASELCGFVTIVAGTFLLHKTRDMGNTQANSDSLRADCELQDHS